MAGPASTLGWLPLTPSRVQRVLGALVEQEAVDYAVVTGRTGNPLAEAGDVPDEGREPVAEGFVPGSPGPGFRTMVEVGRGRILPVGTTSRLQGDEVRQLRSVVTSAM